MVDGPKQPSSQAQVEAVLDDYGNYVNASMARLYRFMGFHTLEISARGATITDVFGHEYIDCGSYGVFFHGHNHPKVVRAVQEQLELMALSGRILPHRAPADLGRLLAEVTPGDLQYTFFCNSGAEAVEGTLKLARAYTGKPDFVACQGAFHGKTFGALSASGRELFRKPFEPLLPGFSHVPFGDAAAIEAAITDRTAAVILEPIQGEGGVRIPPDDYLPKVREICDRKGTLLILDEVQTGIGRTGKMFCCEHSGVVPDIMTMAKSLGGGVMPIGAFTAKPDIFKVFDENPYIHSSTFGGNPLACAAGIAAIKVIQEEALLEQASTKGEYLLRGLRQVSREYPQIVSEVRGQGLLIGVELVEDAFFGLVMSELLDRYVIVIPSLNNNRVMRISPPAVITYQEIDRVIEAFDTGISKANLFYDELKS